MPHYESHSGIEDSLADLALLDALTAPVPPDAAQLRKKQAYKRRDADLDPLLLAAASSYVQVTRNHYAHDFFPAVGDPRAEGAYDWTKWQAEPSKAADQPRPRLKYVSRQEPRSQRMRRQGNAVDETTQVRTSQAAPLACKA